MYDFAHALGDAIEGITHSLCTLEFEDHRPLYDWCVDHVALTDNPQLLQPLLDLSLIHISAPTNSSKPHKPRVAGSIVLRRFATTGLRNNRNKFPTLQLVLVPDHRLRHYFQAGGGLGFMPFRHADAVSYTHLDVYKRQTTICACLRNWMH